MRNTILPALTIALSLSLGGCVTAKQNILLAPISADVPTSASSAIIVKGTVSTPADYVVLKEFQITDTFTQPLKTKTQIPLDLSRQLNQIKLENRADAIVDLKFSLRSIDSSDCQWILNERLIGFISLGGVVYGALQTYAGMHSSLYESTDNYYTTTGISTMIGCGCLSLAGLGGATIHEQFATIKYTYSIEGKAIKFNAGPNAQ